MSAQFPYSLPLGPYDPNNQLLQEDTVLGTHETFVDGVNKIVRNRLRKIAESIQAGSHNVATALTELIKVIQLFQRSM